MSNYICGIYDVYGVMVMGNGYGMYTQARSANDARAIFEKEFLAPFPTAQDEAAAALYARFSEARRRVIENGYTVKARKHA